MGMALKNLEHVSGYDESCEEKMLLFVSFGSADLDLTLTSHWPCDFTQP